MPPPPPSLTSAAARSRGATARTVYLDKSAVFFPKTQIGSKTSTKVQFKNRTEAAVTLAIGPVGGPFRSHPGKTEITVKAKAFLNLPMYYSPTSRGPHETSVQFTGPNGILLTVLLKGVTA